VLTFQCFITLSASANIRPWNTKGEVSQTVDLQFDWFGWVCFANEKQKLSVVIQLIPNQSNRRSMVQWCFPL